MLSITLDIAVKEQNLTEYQNEMDVVWTEIIKESEKGNSFTLTWYENHLITKELRKSGILYGVVLDIGCGLGYRSFLASSGCLIFGIDFSWVAIEYATKHFDLNFCVADILRMPFGDQTFDNAFLLGTIEHIRDLKALISEIDRVLRLRGKLFVSVTDRNYHGHASHVHKFTEASLLAVFKSFTVLQSYVKEHVIFATIQF